MELHPISTNKQENLHLRSGFKLNLQPCPKELQKTWSTQFPTMEKTNDQHWCDFHTQIENHCSLHRVCIPPIDETRVFDDPKGFVVGDHADGLDVDFPFDFQSKPHHYSNKLHHALTKEGVLPTALSSALKSCQHCGCRASELSCRNTIRAQSTFQSTAVSHPNRTESGLSEISFSAANFTSEWVDISSTCPIPLVVDPARMPSLFDFNLVTNLLQRSRLTKKSVNK